MLVFETIFLFNSVKASEMKGWILFKTKKQIGVIIVLTFTINVIILCAGLSFLISSEQGSSQHKLSSKYKTQKLANMEYNSAENSMERRQISHSKNFKSGKRNMFSNQKGQMDFIPSKRMNDERNTSNEKGEPIYQKSGNQDKALLSKRVEAVNKHKLEEIIALANENNGPVYHMYDDNVETEHVKKSAYKHEIEQNSDTDHDVGNIHIGNTLQDDLAVKLDQIYEENHAIPKTFDENYIKYFWSHPEFREKNNNLKVAKIDHRNTGGVNDKMREGKNENGNFQDKHVKNIIKEIPKNNQDKNNAMKNKEPTNVHQKKGRTYITMHPAKGKLGNQMFQLASLLGIAERGNFTPFLQMSQFELDEVFRFPKSFSKSLNISTFKTFSDANYTQDISLKLSQNLNIHINWSLDGWFQSFKYFNNVPAKVRHYLRFKKHLLNTALEFIQKTVPLGHVTVAVHVRRGDFISAYEKKLGRVEVPPEYFHRAMTYYRTNFGNITFIIVSDDMRWCREYIKGDNLVYSTYYHTEKGVDLALISHCDHVIISVGTFGWWGGWLSKGTVVYYNKFPTPGSTLDKTFVHKNYYPSHWIPLE
ncbi:uncharacterized protein LOC132726203 [Ruditapes philippinarum]|uniref:uncharacterized protein LOC132726203 n=1 Tax=Ruditapes philippinarum TaxID=129788 RepID=UPI00295B3071|nr:uncharacterized protein LOC132726203 [Ruditapes philippinarum]